MSLPLQKINFDIYSCSGFNHEFPPTELYAQNHSPLAKGWQSERFCVFPQVLEFNLIPGNCIIKKIQILSHHFKIASKIEIYCGRSKKSMKLSLMNEGDENPIEYEKLGFVDFGDNIKSAYQARELKSIHLEAEGDFLKLIIHKCHINSLNLYNQVGIVALNLLGDFSDSDFFVKTLSDPSRMLLGLDPLIPDPSWNPDHDNKNAAFWGIINKETPSSKNYTIDDLAFDVYQDRHIAKMISAVIRAKDAAVLAEDYVLAKALKTLFDLSKKAGEEVARLEVTKHRAVEVEDYDNADQLRNDVERLKQALMKKMKQLGLKLNESGQIISITKPIEKAVSLTNFNDVEVTIDRPRSEPESDSQVTSIKMFPPISPPAAKPKKPETDKPKGLDTPESLTDDQRDEFAISIEVYGEFIVQCLLSKQFKLREWALTNISKRLETWDDKKSHHVQKPISNHQTTKKNTTKLTGKKNEGSQLDLEGFNPPPVGGWSEDVLKTQEMVRTGWFGEAEAKHVDDKTLVEATFKLVLKGLEDSREKVSTLAFELADQLTRLSVKNKIPEGFVFGQIEFLVPLLLVKSSDMNPRIKSGCQNLVVEIASQFHRMPYSALPLIISSLPHTEVTHWRNIKSRLDILSKLLNEFGVDKEATTGTKKPHRLGLNIENTMKFTLPFLVHNNSEVRDSAVQVVVELVISSNQKSVFQLLKGNEKITLTSQLVKIITDKIVVCKKKRGIEIAENSDNDLLENVKKEKSGVGKLVDVSIEKFKKSKAPPPPLLSENKKVLIEKKKDESGKMVYEIHDNPKNPNCECLFCGFYDENSTELKMNAHYRQDCRMLRSCPLCQQIVEIPYLTLHMISECNRKDLVKRCPRCFEAIMKTEFSNHIARSGCQHCSDPTLRCPFCHVDIPDEANAWKNHLVRGPDCLGNNRKSGKFLKEPIVIAVGKKKLTMQVGYENQRHISGHPLEVPLRRTRFQ